MQRQVVLQNDEELSGVRIRQRRQQDRIDDGEQRRRCRDAGREHHDRHGADRARAAEHAHAVPKGLQHFLERQPAPLIAARLLRPADAAQLPLGGGSGRIRRQAAPLELARELLDVEPQLVSEFPVACTAASDRRNPHEPFTHALRPPSVQACPARPACCLARPGCPRHSLVRRMRLTIEELRSQSSVSRRSWRRPAGVSE